MNRVAPHPILPIRVSFQMRADHLRRACDMADARLSPVQPTGFDQVTEMLVTHTPFEVFDALKAGIFASEVCAVSLLRILEPAYTMAFLSPVRRPQLEALCSQIIDAARVAMDMASSQSGNRPADIFRKYGAALQFITEHVGLFSARELWQDYYLQQTLPTSELLTPDWIDAYTGEAEPFERMLRFRRDVSDAEQAALDAAEAFNAIDEEEEVFDERDPLTPMWQQIAQDFNPKDRNEVCEQMTGPSEALQEVIASAYARAELERVDRMVAFVRSLKAFAGYAEADIRKAVWRSLKWTPADEVGLYPEVSVLSRNIAGYLKRMAESDPSVMTVREMRRGIGAQARAEVRASYYAEAFLDRLQELAELGYHPTSLALQFLRFQHGMGFEEFDCERIHFEHEQFPGITNLMQFIEEYEDEILAEQSSGYHPLEADLKLVEDFCAETLDLYVQQLSAPAENFTPERMQAEKQDVTRHPEYVRAWLTATCEAKVLFRDGKDLRSLAGWEAFRSALSPEGNIAYHAAIRKGASVLEAMKPFWRMVFREKIVGLTSQGARLSGGRFVSWYVLRLKIQNNEVSLTPEKRRQLKDLLAANKWAPDLATIL